MSIDYVAVGDSLTVGVGASFMSPGFVHRFACKMQSHYEEHVCPDIYAKSGITSEEVLSIFQQPTVMNRVKEAEIITITAGGNDLIDATKTYEEQQNQIVFIQALKKCCQNYKRILATIYDAKGKSNPFSIMILDLYNPFPQIPLAEKWIRAFNQHIHSYSSKPYVKIIPVYSLFRHHEQEYLSKDHVHPNDLGYQKMAQLLFEMEKKK